MALVLVAYRDTVRIESEAAFYIEEESCLSFSFSASGYQYLRILLWSEGESVPKGAFVTHFPSGEIQEISIPIDGNFHNFHWRQGDYRAVRAGDRITRMAFEFTLADKASPKLAVGKITVYSLTPEVYRNRIKEALAFARREVDNIPGSLAAGKKRLDARLREMEEAFDKQSPNLNRPLKELLEKVESVADAAGRINLYYEPALRASGRSEIDYCVGSENSLRRVTGANKRLRFQGKVPAEPVVSLARGEHEACQVVILPFDTFLSRVELQASDLENGKGGRIGRENIFLGLAELVRTQLSPHSNGTDLGWVPDPILPLDARGPFNAAPDAELPIWVSVYAPPGTPAGDYSGTLTVTPKNSHPTVVPLKVTVWDYEIPKRGMFRTQGHFSIESVEDFYNRRIDMTWLKEWYSFWLDYRFDPVGQYSPYLTPRPELIPFCLEKGLKTINLGGFSGEGEVDRAALDSVYGSIKEKGWLDYSYVYIGDETDNFALMRQRADVIHARYPGVKVMIGGSIPREELIGYIDVWDPIMNPGGVYGFDAASCRRALDRGEEVLWYVCIGPHPPYPNVQMDDPLVDSRSLFWMTYKYDIMGYEYWGYNFWEKNVRPAGEPRWPEIDWNSYSYDHANGDGQLCYPGPEGLPYPSVRLAVNRDGIEDWESLWLMEDLARTAKELGLTKDKSAAALVLRAGELAAVPDEVVKDLTHYTRDPELILKAREEVSRIIVALQEKIGRERSAEYRSRHIREQRELERKSLEKNIARARREKK